MTNDLRRRGPAVRQAAIELQTANDPVCGGVEVGDLLRFFRRQIEPLIGRDDFAILVLQTRLRQLDERGLPASDKPAALYFRRDDVFPAVRGGSGCAHAFNVIARNETGRPCCLLAGTTAGATRDLTNRGQPSEPVVFHLLPLVVLWRSGNNILKNVILVVG